MILHRRDYIINLDFYISCGDILQLFISGTSSKTYAVFAISIIVSLRQRVNQKIAVALTSPTPSGEIIARFDLLHVPDFTKRYSNSS